MTLLAIVGPTASGKTSLAVHAARTHGAEIVGVDASQIYRGLDIGTGKATEEELGSVRHHLLDVISPNERFDVAAYVRHADASIEDIRSRGSKVVLCGGTGLYLRGLIHGICQAPPTAPSIKAKLLERIEHGELPELHAELARIDPSAAARIAPNDKQRTERALGVFMTTGRPLSDWQREHAFAEQRYPVAYIGVRWPTDVLRTRIEARVDAMLAAGWLGEVARLRESGYAESLQSMQALGYRLLSLHLDGEISLDEARERTIIATRRYAKRQRKWFRSMTEITWIDGPVDIARFDEIVGQVWKQEDV